MVSIVLCFTCVTGVCVCLWDMFEYYQRAVKSRIIIRRQLKKYTDFQEFRKVSRFTRQVEMLIEATGSRKYFRHAGSLYTVSCILMSGTFFMVLIICDFGFAVVCGTFAFAMPYAMLAARLKNMRALRSKEGNQVVCELLIYYRICDYNILEAIQAAAASLEDTNASKPLLYNLARGLQGSVTREEVMKHLNVFRYSIDTTWSNILSTNIFFAHMYGIRVDGALSDLSASIVKGQKILQHSLRENNEAKLILRFLAPLTYGISVVGAIRYFGFTLAKYIRYQFFTSLGLRWFLIMMMIYITGLVINELISKEKMDI